MDIRKSERYTIVDGRQYEAHIDEKAARVKLLRYGVPYFELPLISGLNAAGQIEEKSLEITDISAPQAVDDTVLLTIRAQSDLWGERVFTWTFFEDHLEYQHTAQAGCPGKCYYFSRGTLEPYGNGTSGGIQNTMLPLTTENMFIPTVNHANRYYDTIGEPHEMTISCSLPRNAIFHPIDSADGLYCPPPLCMCFQGKNGWAAIGVGTEPGKYLFNGLVYSGYMFSGAAMYVDYQGYSNFDEGFVSPVMSVTFGYSEYGALEEYVRWCDTKGYTTQFQYPNAPWHRMPIFCGWGEQAVCQYLIGKNAGSFATQEKYEEWIALLEKRNIPYGTVVIDDKWMKTYGTLEIDTEKWPDLKGFIDKEHAKGKHVLLWIPYCQQEGLPPEQCVRVDGRIVCADAGHPGYEKQLRERIADLVGNIGADGFKIDWVGGVRTKEDKREGIELCEGLFGIEFLRRFHKIVYDETHRVKPDALVETQSPNPLFRDCSDVIRLNDVYWSTRNVWDMMRIRAEIAHIVGWKLVDCDSASNVTMNEWWKYCQEQLEMGIPSQYFLSRTELTAEYVPEDMWIQLGEMWRRYIRDNVSQ